jgi:Zinc-finger
MNKGPIKSPRCRICHMDLKTIRKEDPKRRALHFCSNECYEESRELHKIWKKLKAEILFWPPRKPPIDKRKLTYTIANKGGVQYCYKGRKPRSKNQLND